MTQYLSDKLRVLSLVSIILVLYIHSGFHANEIMGMNVNDKVQEFVSGMVGRCAVPLFYIISGYLFFLKVPDGMQSIYGKMKKRVRTLFVPYIIGCLFFVGFLALTEVMPGTSRFMNGGILTLFHKTFLDVTCAIFYDTGNGSPCAFQLWFLQDLIIIVSTSPLWYVCLKRMKWAFVAVAFGLTYLQIPHVPFYALFWFVLGGQLSGSEIVSGGVSWNEELRVKNEESGVGNEELRHEKLIFIFVCSAFVSLSFIQLFLPNAVSWESFRIPITIMGIGTLWKAYDMVVDKYFMLNSHRWLATACQFTFFIYLFHEPTLNIVRKLIVAVLGKNEIGYLTSYLLSPWIFMVCAVFMGMAFRRFLPWVYRVCTGGR